MYRIYNLNLQKGKKKKKKEKKKRPTESHWSSSRIAALLIRSSHSVTGSNTIEHGKTHHHSVDQTPFDRIDEIRRPLPPPRSNSISAS